MSTQSDSAAVEFAAFEHDAFLPDGRPVATDRPEHAPCEAGTTGCCVRHTGDDAGCESW
jgi:hypothetical protein